MAVVVMGGLITSTILTLVVIPALFGWLEKRFGVTALPESLVNVKSKGQ